MTDDDLMELAIAKAREGIAAGQIPVGSVLARGGAVVCAAHNTVWRDTDPSAHGEMNAVRQAARQLGTVDLSGSTVYVTLEPCPMCLTAMHWARVSRVVYGAAIADAKAAGFSELQIPALELARLGQSPIRIEAGPRREECVGLFDQWFRSGKARVY
jgi:tRNA(Arg) A34 adenosine deaminase TadA